MIHVTHHAIERYRERVADLPDAAIVEALSSPTICVAADFGARAVKLSGGQRAIIREHSVLTVVPKGGQWS